VLFKNGNGTVLDLVEGIKVISWKWWLARSKKAHCLYYEWRESGLLQVYICFGKIECC
jgi:hypothetical protein